MFYFKTLNFKDLKATEQWAKVCENALSNNCLFFFEGKTFGGRVNGAIVP